MSAHNCSQMRINAHSCSLMLINCARAMRRAMMAVVLALVLASVVSPWASKAAGAVTLDFDGAEYTATTAEMVTFGWAACKLTINGQEQDCSDCEYEVRIYHVERKSYSDAGKTTGLTKVLKLPRTGHYVIEVRGCRNQPAGSDPPRICSDWATSVNEANRPMVGDVMKKWRIYGRPAAAGDIVVGH